MLPEIKDKPLQLKSDQSYPFLEEIIEGQIEYFSERLRIAQQHQRQVFNHNLGFKNGKKTEE